MKKIFMIIAALCMGMTFVSAQVDSVVVNGNGIYVQYTDTLYTPVDTTMYLDTVAVTYDTVGNAVDTMYTVDTNYTAFDTMYLNMLTAIPDSGWRFVNMVVVSFDSVEYNDTIFSNTICTDWFGMVEYIIVNFDTTPAVGITNIAKNCDVKVYPNPTKGNVTVDADNYRNSTVYSANGTTMTSTTSKHIDMANLPVGVYIIQIKFSDNTLLSYKVVKK